MLSDATTILNNLTINPVNHIPAGKVQQTLIKVENIYQKALFFASNDRIFAPLKKSARCLSSAGRAMD
jgi:hypothetical protein